MAYRTRIFNGLLALCGCLFVGSTLTARGQRPVPVKPEGGVIAPSPPAPPAPHPTLIEQDDDEETVSRQKMPAAGNVIVRLSLLRGDIRVRAWDESAVQVKARGAANVTLERADETTDANTPAKQIEVGFKRANNPRAPIQRGAVLINPPDMNISDVTLDVPRGATVYLRTIEGDVNVDGIAEVSVQAVNGDVTLDRIARYCRAGSANGDIQIANSAGRIELSSVSGDVSAFNVQAVEPGDNLRAVSTSGEVTLEKVSHAVVEAVSVSGEIIYQGELARGGSYKLVNTSGDVTVLLPATSSFKLDAKTAYGTIASDFACHSSEPAATTPAAVKRGKLSGVCGNGEGTAFLRLESFNGTVTLQKQ